MMNLKLEIVNNGFRVYYFGKLYFSYHTSFGDEVFNPLQGTYYSKTRFKNVIADMLCDMTAIRCFWLMLDQYTDFYSRVKI